MNNCLFCTSSIFNFSVKTDKLYKRYVFVDEYEITKRKFLFFKKNIKIDMGFVWDEYLDNNKRLKNNYIGLPYIIEDGYVYEDNAKINPYGNSRFIGSSNFDSWFNRTLGNDRFYYEVVSDEQTGRVKEILVYSKGYLEINFSNGSNIYSYSKTDSNHANEILKEIARSIAEYPYMIVEKRDLIFTNFYDEED